MPPRGVIRRVGLFVRIGFEVGAYSTVGDLIENWQYGFVRVMLQALSFLKYSIGQFSNSFMVDFQRLS